MDNNNILNQYTEKLKIKPPVKAIDGIKININQNPLAINKTQIQNDRDDGEEALDILNRMSKFKLTKVTHKNEEKPDIISKAPDQLNITQIKKKRKQKQTIIIEEDKPIEDEILLGGPELDETGDIIDDTRDENDVSIRNRNPDNATKYQRTKVKKGFMELGDINKIIIGQISLGERLPMNPPIDIRTSKYYMNNREVFVKFINGIFEPYKDELLDDSKNITCDTIGNVSGDISLLTHQKIVRDYMNLYTPYRGLLLYHGLGSGKTCSSIAIAEGMKSQKKIIIMTPASLKRNYLEEIKKCGDLIYKKKQFWEWISIDENPDIVDIAESLSNVLSLSIEYIKRRKGAWLTNITKPSNYNELTTSDKKGLNEQLDEMIQHKYIFINYNGLRTSKFKQLTNNYETNIFENAVVIIDEAHNLISRIVNKINKSAKFSEKRGPNALLSGSLSLQLYEFLLRAENCRVVLLTGTPMINYPNELGILFNILRGYIKTWKLTLSVETNQKMTTDTLRNIFDNEKILDYLDYSPSSKVLTITRNPFGFENSSGKKYDGVTNKMIANKMIANKMITNTDDEFIKKITRVLTNANITVIPRGTSVTFNTALPDTLDSFMGNFINKDTGSVENIEKFKRRIMGLTSYFRSAQEELLPRYDKNFDYHVINVPMSDYQFKVYEDSRQDERKTESNSKSKGPSTTIDKNGLYVESTSTYRIFSRLFCNFAMPIPPGRPNPKDFISDKNIDNIDNIDKNIDKIGDNIDKVLEKEIMIQLADKKALKLEKDRLKEELKVKEKEKKDLIKAENKLEKERIKNENKLEKERIKADEKEKKRLDKQNKGKGGDSDVDAESESDVEVDAESDVDSDFEFKGGSKTNAHEKFMDSLSDDEEINLGHKNVDSNLRINNELEGDELLETMGGTEYRVAISTAFNFLKKHKYKYLNQEALKQYSPKFLDMIKNIEDPEHPGLNLIYSQFRSMEGIGIFSLALEANGFSEFKIRRSGLNNWEINMSEEDMGKPTYALYTGTEDSEEREIIRNIYNGDWDNVPNSIATQLRSKSSNNDMGEIIKVLMITAAGSEGINLRNTRYVHIMEPYWHPVRVEQVIGRARRICSHKSLPIELQTVEVFMYLSVFTPKQLDSEYASELKLKDKSKLTDIPQSSDEKLFEVSNIKENLATQLLRGVKEASIDCGTHVKSTNKEGLVCLSFNNPLKEDFSYNPNYSQDENDIAAQQNRYKVEWEAQKMILPNGKIYAFRAETKQLYDYDSYIQAKKVPGVVPILIGELVTDGNKQYIRKPHM